MPLCLMSQKTSSRASVSAVKTVMAWEGERRGEGMSEEWKRGERVIGGGER